MRASEYLRIINRLDSSIKLMKEDSPSQHLVEQLETVKQELITLMQPLKERVIAQGEHGLFLKTRPMTSEKRWQFFDNWQLGKGALEVYQGIIKRYTSWEYPCMEIFPGIGNCLQHALSGEPLYIVDRDHNMIEQTKSLFNEYYANKRLMSYVIDDYNLSKLPQNSFGFIYCINWTRFEGIKGLTDLATNAYGCLMPGGVLMFNYNPLDVWWAMEIAEEGYAYGADTTDLNRVLESIGYTEIENFKMTPEISYTICKKSGEIEYIKSSSILAKFVDRPEDL